MRRYFVILIFALLCINGILNTSYCQNFNDIRTTSEDEAVFNRMAEFAAGKKDLPTPSLVTEIALQFLGTPYVAGTLESEPEALTINLHETDCILFVEMCIAIAKCVQNNENPTFEDYCNQIRNMRYRNGEVDGYHSRIHYTSEWIAQNEKNGIMREVSSEYGSEYNQTFSFMSSHPKSYKQLRDNDDMVRRIVKCEQELNKATPYYMLTNNELQRAEKSIENGEIIGFISPVEGLDIAHVAIAYWHKGKLHFIHASYGEKRVVIEKKTLVEYAKNGLRLARLL